MSPPNPHATADSPSRELEFKSRGWIDGFEILGADARGARVHILQPSATPSEAARQWSVQEIALGRCAQGTVVALACRRKGLLGVESDAALALRVGSGAHSRLVGACGSLPDRGGAWVPRASLASAPEAAGLEAAWAIARGLPSEQAEALALGLSELARARRERASELARALASEAASSETPAGAAA